MKIVIITGLAYSLVNFRMDLLVELRSRSIEVVALAPSEVSGLSEGKGEIAEVEETLGRIGIPLRTISLSRTSINLVSQISTILEIRKHLLEIKPDLVLAYTVKALVLGMIAARLCGVKKRCAWVTGLGALFSKDAYISRAARSIGYIAFKFSLRLATQIVVQNKDNYGTIVKFCPSLLKKLIILSDGVSLSRFGRLALPDESTIKILFIGRLLVDKGIREFIEVANSIRLKRANCVFQVLGPVDDNPANIKIEEVNQWVEKGIIEYLGPQVDVKPFLEACDIFCLPSYHEGLPRTVLEAMAVGRPIVTTSAPGCAETIEREVSGLMVEAGSTSQLEEAILRLIDDRELRLRLSEAAFIRVQNSFDSVAAARKMCDNLMA